MRRFLVRRARALALVSAVLWQSAQGAGPARAADARDLDEQTLVDTEVHRWGFGVEQAVDSANLLLYAQAHFYDPTLVGFPCTFDPDPKNPGKTVCGGDPSQTTKLPPASWQGFVVGARIQF
ncbi:MAG TPA: hypothetical protein VH913_09875 [Hyphomicrobiaceae bacterium]|jgi:hypothetical protein